MFNVGDRVKIVDFEFKEEHPDLIGSFGIVIKDPEEFELFPSVQQEGVFIQWEDVPQSFLDREELTVKNVQYMYFHELELADPPTTGDCL